MIAPRPRLRVFLDEGVAISVAETFTKHGHEVILLSDAIARGSADIAVFAAADANGAILVAHDGDMKSLAKRYGIKGGRFSRFSLIKLDCPEPMAAKRLDFAMSFIEHEWQVSEQKVARRLFVDIGKHVLRSHR